MLISKFLHLSDLILTVLPQVGDDAGRFKKEDEGSKGSHGALPGAQSNLHTTILTRYGYSKQREDDLRSGLNSKLCKGVGNGKGWAVIKTSSDVLKKQKNRTG